MCVFSSQFVTNIWCFKVWDLKGSCVLFQSSDPPSPSALSLINLNLSLFRSSLINMWLFCQTFTLAFAWRAPDRPDWLRFDTRDTAWRLASRRWVCSQNCPLLCVVPWTSPCTRKLDESGENSCLFSPNRLYPWIYLPNALLRYLRTVRDRRNNDRVECH